MTLAVGILQVIEGRFINTYILVVIIFTIIASIHSCGYYFYHYCFDPPLSCEVRFIVLLNIRLIRVANYCDVCMSCENSVFTYVNVSVADFTKLRGIVINRGFFTVVALKRTHFGTVKNNIYYVNWSVIG